MNDWVNLLFVLDLKGGVPTVAFTCLREDAERTVRDFARGELNGRQGSHNHRVRADVGPIAIDASYVAAVYTGPAAPSQGSAAMAPLGRPTAARS